MTASRSKPPQLSLFPNQVRLTHSISDANRHRFYLLRTLPTLFGDWVLLRESGRIGSPGRVRRDRHRSEGEATTALARLARQKHRRGYALQEMI
ncbi:MAG: WGR domain-containing protein [Alphaproteobacteria bacterium]|nr:WGR domain-containing protein [Alphaproteobacteria bacterium]